MGLAPDTPFATKPQLAQRMLTRVLEAGLAVAWVTGDTFYGRSTDLRRGLEDAGVHHVLAVPRNESLWVGRDIWTPEAVHAVHAGREWYRHVTLALWVLALLAVVQAADLARPDPQKKSALPGSLTDFRRARGLAGG